MRTFKSAWRREGEELHLRPWPQRLQWIWEVASEYQTMYSDQDQFLRCGFKMQRTWQGSYRNDMAGNLLKFLVDGDEGRTNMEAEYEMGNTTCNLKTRYPDPDDATEAPGEDDLFAGDDSVLFAGSPGVDELKGTFGFTPSTSSTRPAAAAAAKTGVCHFRLRKENTEFAVDWTPGASSSSSAGPQLRAASEPSLTPAPSTVGSSTSTAVPTGTAQGVDPDAWIPEDADWFHIADEERSIDKTDDEDDYDLLEHTDGGDLIEIDPDWVDPEADEAAE